MGGSGNKGLGSTWDEYGIMKNDVKKIQHHLTYKMLIRCSTHRKSYINTLLYCNTVWTYTPVESEMDLPFFWLVNRINTQNKMADPVAEVSSARTFKIAKLSKCKNIFEKLKVGTLLNLSICDIYLIRIRLRISSMFYRQRCLRWDRV